MQPKPRARLQQAILVATVLYAAGAVVLLAARPPQFLLIAGGGLILLLIVCQAVTLRENRRLAARWQAADEERARLMTTRAAELSALQKHIKEREWAEEELGHFFTLSLDMLCIAGFDGYFKRLNPSWERTLGFSCEELTAQPFIEFVHPDDRAATIAESQKLASGAVTISFENRYLCKDGSYKWVLWNCAPWPGRELIYAAALDITAQKQAAQEMRDMQNFLTSIVENIPDMIFVKDAAELRFVRFNRAGEELLGAPRETLIGKSDYDLFPADEVEFFIAKDRAVLDGGKLLDIPEEPIHTPRGTRILHTKKIPILDGAGVPQYLLGISEDITERKNAEGEIQRQAQELARSNQELEQFAYVASHDLQEPLRMVSSYTQLLARRYKGKLDDDADEFIAFAVDGARRMQTLIQDLLAYSRVGSRGNPFELVDCEAVLDDALANLTIAIADDAAIVTHDALPTIIADRTQMIQLLQNLIGNAIKFHKKDEPPRVHIGTRRDAESDDWVFSVRDNGPGIEAQYFERIFLIFQRLHTREEYSGTGIGLAVCKKIVDRHGGRITVASEPGQGTTFSFTIPDREAIDDEREIAGNTVGRR